MLFLLFYVHSKQLNGHVGTVSYPRHKHTFPGQARLESVQKIFFPQISSLSDILIYLQIESFHFILLSVSDRKKFIIDVCMFMNNIKKMNGLLLVYGQACVSKAVTQNFLHIRQLPFMKQRKESESMLPDRVSNPGPLAL